MAIEEGAKVSGKISGITNFGAFVDLDDNQTGLVHISQISDLFIKDIHDAVSRRYGNCQGNEDWQ